METPQLTQEEIVLQLLRKHPCNPSHFMRAGIAQYNARIHYLRKAGHNIVKTSDKWIKKGATLVRATVYTLMD